MKSLKRVWQEISQGENIEVYILIIAAIILCILNICSGSINDSVQWGLWGFFAIVLLNIKRAISTIAKHYKSKSEEVFFSSFPDEIQDEIDNNLETADEVLCIGITLDRTWEKHSHRLEKRSRQGGKIKIALLNPDSPVYETMLLRYTSATAVTLQTQKRNAEDRLRNLLHIQGNIEVRLYDYPLGFGGIVTSTKDADKAMHIWHYAFRTPIPHIPKFRLHPRENVVGYRCYLSQFEAIWESAKPASTP